MYSNNYKMNNLEKYIEDNNLPYVIIDYNEGHTSKKGCESGKISVDHINRDKLNNFGIIDFKNNRFCLNFF
jgi:hypothetical protein